MTETSSRAVTELTTSTLFAALGDPIRLAVLRQLQHGPQTAGGLAAGFRVTRPAVSRHLRVLRDAGWVVERRSGRNRVYRLSAGALAAALEWLGGLGRPPGGPRGEPRPAGAGQPSRPREAWAPWSD